MKNNQVSYLFIATHIFCKHKSDKLRLCRSTLWHCVERCFPSLLYTSLHSWVSSNFNWVLINSSIKNANINWEFTQISILSFSVTNIFKFASTVKPVYKGQPWGITKVPFVDRWSLFGVPGTTDFHRMNQDWPW